MIGLIDWTASDVEPILPDYSISPWELAQALVPHMNFYDVENTLGTFMIGSDHEEMIEALQMLEKTSSSTDASSTIVKSAGNGNWPFVYCSRLLAASSGGLTACLGKCADEELNSDVVEHWRGAVATASSGRSFTRAQPLHIDGTLSAILCEHAMPHDVLIPVVGELSGLLLVVRQSNTCTDRYDIVGQGMLVNGCSLGSEMFPKLEDLVEYEAEKLPNSFIAKVEVELSAVEILVLVGQDMTLGEPGKEDQRSYDVKARFRRLSTNPSASLNGAVTITKMSHHASRTNTTVI